MVGKKSIRKRHATHQTQHASPPRKSLGLITLRQGLGKFHTLSTQHLNSVTAPRRSITNPYQSMRNDSQAEILFQRITHDNQIGHFFEGHLQSETLRNVHSTMLNAIQGGQLTFNVDLIRAKHKHMHIQEKDYDQMKRVYIQYLMDQGINALQIMRCIQQMEQYKPYIVNQPSLYEAMGKDAGIQRIITRLKIFIEGDYILGVHFMKFTKERIRHIFTKMIQQILNNFEPPSNVRSHHSKLDLTHFHYSRFKFYLSESMIAENIPMITVRQFILLMDKYKTTILDKDNILDLIEKSEGGMSEFISRFAKICCDEPLLQVLIAKKGMDKFIQLSELVFFYLLEKHPHSLNFTDIASLLVTKNFIPPSIIQNVKTKVLRLIETYRPDIIMLEDFMEKVDGVYDALFLKWDIAIDLEEPRVQQFMGQIVHQIREMPIIIKIYQDCDVDVEDSIRRKLFCLSSRLKRFKRTDIRNIHKNMKIHNYTFNEFVNIFKQLTVKNYPDMMWLVEKIEMYRQYIVNE